MKIQHLAVIFIIIVVPISLVLSTYIDNMRKVASKDSEYRKIVVSSTYDAVQAYQINSLDNDYNANMDSKLRDINATTNSFFNSLALGLSSSGLTKEELKQYVPAILYSMYDGYYIYSARKNYAKVDANKKVEFLKAESDARTDYGLKNYVYYSCQYKDNGSDTNIIINFSLDNYMHVYGYKNGKYINESGYYIVTSKIKGNTADNSTSTLSEYMKNKLYSDNNLKLEDIGEDLKENISYYDLRNYYLSNGVVKEYLIPNIDDTIPENQVDFKKSIEEQEDELEKMKDNPKPFNYLIYNGTKYYFDEEHANNPLLYYNYGRIQTGNTSSREANYSFNSSYTGVPIFKLENNLRVYCSIGELHSIETYIMNTIKNAKIEQKSVPEDNTQVGYEINIKNNKEWLISDWNQYFKDYNSYNCYTQSIEFSNKVYDFIKDIKLGDITSPEYLTQYATDLEYENSGTDRKYSIEHSLVKDNGKNGVSILNSTEKPFDISEKNDPEDESSEFNKHRMDVIISSIESGLINAMKNFSQYMDKSSYEYALPVLTEQDWDTITNNIAITSFVQGFTIGNYKYFSDYAIVANTSTKDFVDRKSFYINHNNNGKEEYHNPGCEDLINSTENDYISYRTVDYRRDLFSYNIYRLPSYKERYTTIIKNKNQEQIPVTLDEGNLKSNGNNTGKNIFSPYFPDVDTTSKTVMRTVNYFYQLGYACYDCVVTNNKRKISINEIITKDKVDDENGNNIIINNDVKKAYIKALYRERGSIHRYGET